MVIATMVILVFGEIIPQAVCVRYGLCIGALFKPVVNLFVIIFYPICWPISKVLDLILGRDIGQVYSKQELKHLISLHCMDNDANKESGLTTDDHKLLKGAFEYKEKCVRDVMTALDKVFMLDICTRLCPKTMLDIYRTGFTRIPVYNKRKNDIIGVLYTKDLILIDPDDEVGVSTILGFREAVNDECNSPAYKKEYMFIGEDTKLDYVLKLFQQRCSHMLFATGADEAVTGVITLEDVLEEMINDEIVDESDNVVDTNHPEKVNCHKRSHDLSRFLQSMLCTPSSDKLSAEEVSAIVAYLIHNSTEFKIFKDCEIVLLGLVTNHSEVIDIPSTDEGSPTHSRRSSSQDSDIDGEHKILVEQGVATDEFTLILQGKVLIESGKERFQLELGPWTRLCEKALSEEQNYIPDFTAKLALSHPSRVIQIRKSAYVAAMHAAALEKLSGGDSSPITSSKDFLLSRGHMES
mmetsp:Transcript_15426/g.39285  ORF Transcript_15426/g.39285 Transcript_15426/m.39285 type:complete len:466 (+) Transcript_15426:485-1882(+)